MRTHQVASRDVLGFHPYMRMFAEFQIWLELRGDHIARCQGGPMNDPEPVRDSMKARLVRGEQLLGVLLRMPSEELTEMVALSGFDLRPDRLRARPGGPGLAAQPHRPGRLPRRRRDGPHRFGGAGPGPSRAGSGRDRIVAPHVDTPEQAQALVNSVHYPPLGHRGFATYSRAGQFGLVTPQEHRQRFLDETLVFAMIESPAAVAEAAAILDVPGLDGTMIGNCRPRCLETPRRARCAGVGGVGSCRSGRLASIADGHRPRCRAGRGSLADGADLVVYNLAHSIMGHLHELAAARRT